MALKKQGKARQKKPGVRKFKKNKKTGNENSSKKRTQLSKKNKKGKGKSSSVGPNPAILSHKKKPQLENDGTPEEMVVSSEKKRVSFARKLVKKKDAGKAASTKSPDPGLAPEVNGSPLKPILKRRKDSTALEGGTAKAKRIRTEDAGKSAKKNATKTAEGSTVPLENEDQEKPKMKEGKGIAGEKKRTNLSVSVKEQLQTMTKKERRAFLRQLRAKRKPYFELAIKAKTLWEKIRSKRKANVDDRERLIDQLYSLVEGKVKQLIYAHDTVRVIQCLMALKRHAELRTKLFEEVREEILPMTKSKYAKFFVIKMLKYGTPAQREYIIQQFYGKIPHLLKHSVASEVVEYAYNEYANALQRSRMVSEFYSPEFALWKVDEAVSINEILEKQPARQAAILQSMKEHILDLSTKPVLRHTLVHRLIKEFLERCDEAQRKEVIDSLKERVIEMIHTKDGVICAMKCVWYASAKDRKTIVKTFKSLVLKACCEEHGHLALLAIFDVVKDTALVQKIILKEIKQNLDQIIKNKYGMKVLHYLLKPRCGIHFIKPIVGLLAEGDSTVKSKEEMDAIHNELLEYISPALLSYCVDHMEELMMDAHACLLVLSILENAAGDKADAFRVLCNDVMAEEFIPMNIDRLHAVETPHCHFVLKKLIQHDSTVSGRGETTFSETLISELSDDHFLSWMSCNKGAFILIYMYETGISTVQEKVVAVVNSPSGKKKLKQYTFPAVKILATKCLQNGP